MNYFTITITTLIIIVSAFLIRLVFFGKKNLIKNTLDSIIIIQVKIFEHLSTKLSKKYNEKTSKLIAGSIVNIIFQNRPVSKEQEYFVIKNINLIENEIKSLKNDRKICKVLRDSVVLSIITPDVPPNGNKKATLKDAKELSSALSPFMKYNLFEKDELFNEKPVNPVSFISMARRLSFD